MLVSAHLHYELGNMLTVKHIQVLDYHFHFLHHHIHVFGNNPSVLMLSFTLLLFLLIL